MEEDKIDEEEYGGGCLEIISWGCVIPIIGFFITIAIFSAGFRPDNANGIGMMFVIFTAITAVIIIYFIPSIIAFHVKHPHKWPIFIVNLLFGTVLIGWVGSFIWCFLFREPNKEKRVHVTLKKE